MLCGVQVEIREVRDNIGVRVKVFGWVHTLRSQGSLQFLELRDGTGIPALLQTVFAPPCSQTFEAISLHREASVCVFGTLKADERAKGGVELQADYWELIGVSNGEVEGIINKDSNPDVLADQRHIAIRDINAGYILKLRSTAIHWSDTQFSGDGESVLRTIG